MGDNFKDMVGEYLDHGKWSRCQKKKGYDTEYEAINAFYEAVQRDPKNKEVLERYQCQHCGKWHLGHKQHGRKK